MKENEAMAAATLAFGTYDGTARRRQPAPGGGCSRGRNLVESTLDPDSSLVSRCLRGDETAWEELVRLHTRKVYALCYRFTGSGSEAQDLTQEVFLRVFRTITDLPFDGRLVRHLAGAGDA